MILFQYATFANTCKLRVIEPSCGHYQSRVNSPHKRPVTQYFSLMLRSAWQTVGQVVIVDNGLSPSRRQAIIWTNGWILLIRNIGINFSEILSEIYTFSFKKIHLKISSGKWRSFCLGLNVWTHCSLGTIHDDMDLGQHWLTWWLAAWLHQAITWTNKN